MATVVQDPWPDYVKNSNIGKYISNQPILSLKVFMSFWILKTEHAIYMTPDNTNWKVKYVVKDYRNDEYEAGWFSSSCY